MNYVTSYSLHGGFVGKHLFNFIKNDRSISNRYRYFCSALYENVTLSRFNKFADVVNIDKVGFMGPVKLILWQIGLQLLQGFLYDKFPSGIGENCCVGLICDYVLNISGVFHDETTIHIKY